MNLDDFLAFRKRIDMELARFLHGERRNTDKFTRFVLEELEKFALRDGKRLRPILVLIGYSMCSGKKIPDEVFRAAIAIELLHDFLLIHDDIIDESSLRRGKPTMHKLVETDAGRKGGKLGKDIALVAGDILFSYSFKAIERSGIEEGKKRGLYEIFNMAVAETCMGQIQDIFLSSKDISKVNEKIVNRFNSVKTTAYTIEAPLKMGAMMAAASKRQLRDIGLFSRPLGQAFQLRDDLLGLFGTESEIGKPPTSDIEEGKKTFPIVAAYVAASGREKRFIEACLGRKISKEKFKRLKMLIVKLGARRRSEERLNSLVMQGNRRIMASCFTKEHKKVLLDLSEKWFI